MQMIAGTDFTRRRRGPFLAPVEIIVLAAMVGALLFLLFPGRDFENPTFLARPDELSMAYLRMLLRAHPDQAEARILLVQEQMALGKLEEAHETLKPLRGRKDALGQRAEVLALKLDRTRLYAIPPEDPLRRSMQEEVRLAARNLIPRTTRPDDLADLADFVLSLGDPGEAALAYQHLAVLDKANAIGWLEKAGRWSYAAGDPAMAARCYSEAALGTSDARQGVRLAKDALIALLAANQGKSGVAVARPLIEKYPKDLDLLEQGIRMAVASGDMNTARRWGEQRIIAAGSSEKALREQMDILMKAGDPEGALKMARTLLQRNPGDAALHKQAAQLARWSSQPEESMGYWTWLARRGNEEGRKNALDLAQALADVQTEVEMLELRMKQARRMSAPRVPELDQLRKPRVAPPGTWSARRRPLGLVGGDRDRATGRLAQMKKKSSDAPVEVTKPAEAAKKPEPKKPPAKGSNSNEFELPELIALADALEAKGLPERAIKAMDEFRFNFAERPEYWVRIARLYENSFELEQALACLEQLNRLKAMTLDDALRQAKLLWRLLRPEAALTRLISLRGQARETETEYWKLVGELAWRVENDLLAAEAYAILWKNNKSPDVGENYFRSLDSLGRTEEAITIAEEGYARFGQSNFLVAAVDIAVREGLLERAKGLFAKAGGKEKQFELESRFWFQRALLAFGEERPAEAERDLQRVLAIDPGSEEAHIEWLTLAVHAQDRGMAARALRNWGKSAENNVETWGLLADAYTLLQDERRAAQFRKRARDERAKQRIANGRPMTPEEHMEEAIEAKDKVSIQNGLKLYGNTLSLPMRIGALRELGRDEDAWDLINAAGLTSQRRASEDALNLAADIRDLREGYLDGAWGWGQLNSLGELDERNIGARFELRLGKFFVGAEGSFDKLSAPTNRANLLMFGDEEQRAFFNARLKERFGETSLHAGAEFLPEGYRPHVELGQRLSLFRSRFELNVVGKYGEIPRHSALLRMAGLRDGVDADFTIVVAGPFEIGGSAWLGRFVTRYNEDLTQEKGGRLEMAFRLPFKTAFVRPRIEGMANRVPPISNDIPTYLRPLLSGMENPEDLLSLQYATAGLGLTIGSTQADVGEALGPHISLRYQLDGWAGYVWPSERPSYAADGAVGLVFARHQELSLRGFYYSDFRNAAGESFWGGSVNYTLRWFR
jgi:tetratricopeptide (TPR) repeat protein